MFNSTVLDVAVGLIFTFLAFSLAVSAIVEGLASARRWRSATLLQGMKDLLNDQDLKGLAGELYRHALVNPREPGTLAANQVANVSSSSASQPANAGGAPSPVGAKRPAYINPSQFASAMVDIIGLAGRGPDAMKQAIDSNAMIKDDPQLKLLLNGIVDRTGGKLQDVQKELAGWFDNAMDRVGGDYKRKTQLWGFVVALVMAAALNISAINIGQTLWVRPMIAKAIAPQVDLLKFDPNKNAADQFKGLSELGIPVGWTTNDFAQLFPGCKGHLPVGWPDAGLCFNLLAGWLITAIAALFGAPFWFDALQQIVRLKGAGPSPAEKKSDTAAAN